MSVGQRGRQLASAFSTRCIRQLASKNHPWPQDRLLPILELAGPGATLGEAFDNAYAYLRREYRCEYVYANSLIAAATRADAAVTATVGLPVFMSVADLVITGTRPAVYEIKTDLDDFARLDLQLHSYGRCFEHVNVLTSPGQGGARHRRNRPASRGADS